MSHYFYLQFVFDFLIIELIIVRLYIMIHNFLVHLLFYLMSKRTKKMNK
jgi:hypothetical protein